MELLVAAQTKTGELGADEPVPPTESPTAEGLARTGLRKPQAVFATVIAAHEKTCPAANLVFK
jgi:hypothetical protein